MENPKSVSIGSEELSVEKKLWRTFEKVFLGIVFLHFLLKGYARSLDDQFISVSTSAALIALQLIPALIMVVHVGRYSYKFSKDRKKSILTSLLGFVWFGVVGICFAYFAVQQQYHNAIGKTVPKKSRARINIVKIVCALVVFGVILSLAISALKPKDSLSDEIPVTPEASINWVNVISPDGKLSVDLPKNWKFNPDNQDGGNIYSYSWIAKDEDSSIAYVVKYEDYEPVFKEENITDLNSTDRHNFLKGLADNQIKEFSASNFSSQFINIQGYDSIKYTASIGTNKEPMNIQVQGTPIVGHSFYVIN